MVFNVSIAKTGIIKFIIIFVFALVLISLWIKAAEAFLLGFTNHNSAYPWAVFGVCGLIISIVFLSTFENLIPENIFGGLFIFRFGIP